MGTSYSPDAFFRRSIIEADNPCLVWLLSSTAAFAASTCSSWSAHMETLINMTLRGEGLPVTACRCKPPCV